MYNLPARRLLSHVAHVLAHTFRYGRFVHLGGEDVARISFMLKGVHGVKHVQHTRGQHGDHLELGPADVPGRFPADGYYLVAVRQYAGAMTLSAAAVVGVDRTHHSTRASRSVSVGHVSIVITFA